MPVLFSPPAVAPVTLLVPPVLESWDAAGHPSRQRLSAYLDSVAALAPQAVAEDGAPLALVLDVGLSREVALTRGGRDLDNYLFPLARRFGAARFPRGGARSVAPVGGSRPGRRADVPRGGAAGAGDRRPHPLQGLTACPDEPRQGAAPEVRVRP